MLGGIKNKKLLYVSMAILVVIFVFPLLFIGTATALELENQYPKIPLPDFGSIKFDGNYSLNDIAGRIKPPFNTLDSLSGLIYYLFTFAVSVVGIIAFGVIIYTGVMFIMSGSRPQLRAQAMGRIRNTILGIALLLGSVIILNTINPELTIINVPPVDWKFSKPEWPSISPRTKIDLDTLRYGGVVLFAESALDGRENRSETILNRIENFNDGTFIGDDDLSAIKVLGACRIKLFRNKGFEAGVLDLVPFQTLELQGPTSGTIGHRTFENDSASSLNFTDTSCLGHSITAYSGLGYKHQVKAFIASDENLVGDKLLMHRQCPALPETVGDILGGELYDHCNLPEMTVRNHEHNADNNIESIAFAREPLEEFNITACKHPTNETNRGEDCKNILQSASLGGAFQDLFNEVSAIIFGGNGKNRQAGMVLYDEDNFEGKSEIFIVGDRNLEKNFIGTDSISSLKIIGKYKITLYEKDRNDHDKNPGKILVFDNTENSVGIVEIKNLSSRSLDGTNNWDNKVSAVKIEVPQEIYLGQHLGAASCTTALCEL